MFIFSAICAKIQPWVVEKQQNLRKELSGKNKNADNIQLWCRITKTEYPDPPDTSVPTS